MHPFYQFCIGKICKLVSSERVKAPICGDSVPSAVCQHHFCYHKCELQGGQWRVLTNCTMLNSFSGADQGFPSGKRRNQRGRGCQPIFLVKFPQKLHENEENWTGRREASKICLCRSATDSHRFFRHNSECVAHLTWI